MLSVGKNVSKAEPKFSCCYLTARSVNWATLSAQAPHTDDLQLGATETCSKVSWNTGWGKAEESTAQRPCILSHHKKGITENDFQEILKMFLKGGQNIPSHISHFKIYTFYLEIHNFWDSNSF